MFYFMSVHSEVMLDPKNSITYISILYYYEQDYEHSINKSHNISIMQNISDVVASIKVIIHFFLNELW